MKLFTIPKIMNNVNLIFLEKYRSSFINTAKWYVGKSSLGLEWIIPYLNNLNYETNYINPNILRSNNLKKRSEYIFNECKNILNKKKINLLIATINDSDLHTKYLDKIKRLGIFTVNIQNDSWNNQFAFQKINSSFDLQWLPYRPSKYVYKMLKLKKINYIELPWAGIPYETDSEKRINKIFFYGSKNKSREHLVHRLAQEQISLDIYGGGWLEEDKIIDKNKMKSFNIKNQLYLMREPYYFQRILAKIKLNLFHKQYLTDMNLINKIHILKGYIESKNRVSNLSKYLISLGSSSLGSTYVLKNPVNISRGRDWELSGMGVMMITAKDSVLSESFVEDKEIVFYENTDNLKDKIKYYLKNPEIAKKIGQSAKQKIKDHHNFDIRIKTIIRELNK